MSEKFEKENVKGKGLEMDFIHSASSCGRHYWKETPTNPNQS